MARINSTDDCVVQVEQVTLLGKADIGVAAVAPCSLFVLPRSESLSMYVCM